MSGICFHIINWRRGKWGNRTGHAWNTDGARLWVHEFDQILSSLHSLHLKIPIIFKKFIKPFDNIYSFLKNWQNLGAEINLRDHCVLQAGKLRPRAKKGLTHGQPASQGEPQSTALRWLLLGPTVITRPLASTSLYILSSLIQIWSHTGRTWGFGDHASLFSPTSFKLWSPHIWLYAFIRNYTAQAWRSSLRPEEQATNTERMWLWSHLSPV